MRKRGIPDTRGHELAGAAVAAASVATKHRRLGSHDEMRSVALALTRPGMREASGSMFYWVRTTKRRDREMFV